VFVLSTVTVTQAPQLKPFPRTTEVKIQLIKEGRTTPLSDRGGP
jgi:hypothetical protein